MDRARSVSRDSAHSTRQPALLRLRRGASPLALWAFGRDDTDQIVTVGSSKGCDWQITAAGVAPLELSFLYTGEALYVSSARPSTGARINGARLGSDWVPLASGTRIDVGTACIEAFVRHRPGEAPSNRARPMDMKATTIGHAPPQIIPPQVDPFDIPISRATLAYDSPFTRDEPAHAVRKAEATQQLFAPPELTKVAPGHMPTRPETPRAKPVPLTQEVSVPQRVQQATARVQMPAAGHDEADHAPMSPRARGVGAAARATGTGTSRPTAAPEHTDVWSIAGSEAPFQPEGPGRGSRASLSPGHHSFSSIARHGLIALGVVIAYALWIIILNRL